VFVFIYLLKIIIRQTKNNYLQHPLELLKGLILFI